MSAIEAIAQKIFDFRSTLTSCLVWFASIRAALYGSTPPRSRLNNTNPECEILPAPVRAI